MFELRRYLAAGAAFLLIAAMTACGNAGHGASVPSTQNGANVSGGGAATGSALTVNVHIPSSSSANAQARTPKYVSPSTLGATITAYGALTSPPSSPTMVANLSAGSSSCTTKSDGSRSCSISLEAAVGTDVFVIDTYDQAPVNGVIPQGAKLLSTATLIDTILANQANTLSVTLNGVPESIVLSPPGILIPPNVTSSFSDRFYVNAKDADGNYIVGSGNYVSPIALAIAGDSNDTLSLSTTSISSPAASSVTVTYNGGSLPGTATITGSASGATSGSLTVQVSATVTIDVPSALGSQTQALGVNNSGQIVGRYVDSGGTSHGFLLSGGSFTTIDFPGATSGTTANGINNQGVIVGNDNLNAPSTQTVVGFYLSGSSFTTIQYSNTFHTVLLGINDSGASAGYCSTNQSFAGACTTFLGIPPGFILSGIGGTFTFLNATSLGACTETSVGSDAEGINNAGEVVGGWEDCSGGEHGYSFAGSTYTDIDVPGNSGSTLAHGINNLGQIVGWTRNVGFLLSGGSYTTFNIPGATTTSAQGINDNGEIVGYYQDASGNQHGFITVSGSLPAAAHRR